MQFWCGNVDLQMFVHTSSVSQLFRAYFDVIQEIFKNLNMECCLDAACCEKIKHLDDEMKDVSISWFINITVVMFNGNG